MPRKSRMRGSTMFTSLSKNAYMRSPRKVTFAPICMPSRSLYVAMLFFARVTTGFCPVIATRSDTAPSIAFGFSIASPTPMLTTIFTSRGTSIGFFSSKRLRSAGTTCFSYRSLSLFMALRLHRSIGGLSAPPARPLLRVPLDDERDLRGLVAFRAHVHDARDRHRQLLVEDARLRFRRRLRVPLDDVDAFHFDHAVAVADELHASALAFVAAVQHDDRVAGREPHLHRHQSTSGASDTIFMKSRSRSSRATGPKMRVPRGFFWSLMSTAAFSSNRMNDPSTRRSFFFRSEEHTSELQS